MKSMKVAMIVLGAMGVLNAALLFCCVRVGAQADAHLNVREKEFDGLDENWWEDEMDGYE